MLTFEGYSVEYEDIQSVCRLSHLGALDYIAIQSLQEAGWDVEVVTDLDLEAIRSALKEDRPLIISLPLGAVGSVSLLHAVVVCDLTDETVIVMDPLIGDYRTIRLDDPVLNYGVALVDGFFIGGAADQIQL